MSPQRRRSSAQASGARESLGRPLVVVAISLAGLVGVVVAVYLVVVLGLGHVPTAQQKTLLGFSMLAAAVSALLYVPVAETTLGYRDPSRAA